MEQKNYRVLLSEKQFLKLILANVVSRFGDSLDVIAYTWIIYEVMIVYVYRRKHLEQVVSDAGCQRFLEWSGYPTSNLDGLLAHLAYRLKTQPDFPHEIGVFLGYPLKDVIGFIQNKGQNFTCCGLWKSYSDPAEMQVCFACYRRCIETYVSLFEQGIPIERLAVSA